MKIFYKIALLFIALIGQQASFGQDKAIATLDTNSILIGDQIYLQLKVKLPKDAMLEWPKIETTIASTIEVISRSAVDTIVSENKEQLSLKLNLLITSFDSGYYAIPPFEFKYHLPNDTASYLLNTDAILLEVMNLDVDPSTDIKDIKSPLEAPYTFKEALPWILIALAIMAISFGIFYYLRKRKNEEPVFRLPSKPKLPPHQIALDALGELRLKKLWQNGREKQYHSELTEIIRKYISERFGIHAMEFTSDEIMEAVNNTATNPQAKDKLHQTLFLADMVKFAKMRPSPLEHDQSLNHASDFVKETIGVVDSIDSSEHQSKETASLEVDLNKSNEINTIEEGKKE